LSRRVKKRIIVSVTNDLVCDNRVNKVCSTLSDMGFDILLAGRKLSGSPEFNPQNYKTCRFRLLFNKGPLFYACYNCRLFCFLLFSGFDLLLANDLDTLPANYIVSRIKKKPLVYDSHEYFTEVPELIDRPKVKRFWEWLERKMVPRLEHAYTVCDSIAKIYTEKYNTVFHVVRNVSSVRFSPDDESGSRNVTPKMILYQGAVNARRGLRQAVLSMKMVEGANLIIAGDGDERPDIENLVKQEGLGEKVIFMGRLPFEELIKLTPLASIGLSIEEDKGLNYHYALPNKLFDYIASLVPVVVSDLPEMARIVHKYNIGVVTSSLQPEKLAGIFQEMLNNRDKRKKWIRNLRQAALELTWENEEKKLKKIFRPFL